MVEVVKPSESAVRISITKMRVRNISYDAGMYRAMEAVSYLYVNVQTEFQSIDALLPIL
jgi:hypothetical protein